LLANEARLKTTISILLGKYAPINRNSDMKHLISHLITATIVSSIALGEDSPIHSNKTITIVSSIALSDIATLQSNEMITIVSSIVLGEDGSVQSNETTASSSVVPSEDPPVLSEEEKAEIRHDGIYYFQQQALPIRVLSSKGKLFRDLEEGIPPSVIKEAQRNVDEEFANAMQLKAYPIKKAYVIIFPEPTDAAECYFSLIKQEDDQLEYYVLEKGINPFSIEESSRLYMWNQDGQQVNYGRRKYTDLKTFVGEVLYGKDPEA
jgi:hypothetical protein